MIGYKRLYRRRVNFSNRFYLRIYSITKVLECLNMDEQIVEGLFH